MRRKLFGLALACLLLAAGCGKEAQADRGARVESALVELDSFTREVVRRVEEAQDPSVGVDEAQKYFDSRREEMRAKLQPLREVEGSPAGDGELRRKVLERVTEDAFSVSNLKSRYMTAAMRDPGFQARLDKLVGDYNALINARAPGGR